MLPSDCEVVCLTAWDEPLYSQALLWVNDIRRVYILSDCERVSPDPRVQIYWMQTFLQKEALLRKIAWASVFRTLHVIGPFKEELEECHRAADGILSDAADYWVKILQNARANAMPYRRGMELKGVFPNVPAVIVGAGPSLKKHKEFLRLFQDRALIFAGGTALSLIDIKPHFAAALDPHVPCAKTAAPLCYQARVHPGSCSSGERLLFPDSASSALNWIYGEETWDAGWTVGNFMTAIALLMGCSPLIFIGMDFCYSETLTQKDWLLAASWTQKQKGSLFDTSSGILKVPKITIEEALDLCPRAQDFQVDQKIQALALHHTHRFQEWQGDVMHDHLLEPLWQIWRPVFERETGKEHIELHKQLFFQKVIEEHGKER